MRTDFVQIEREYGFVERQGLSLNEVINHPAVKADNLESALIAAKFASDGHYTAPCGTRFMSMDTLMKPENSWRTRQLSDFTYAGN